MSLGIIPSIGRIVVYRLTKWNVDAIKLERHRRGIHGNEVEEGQAFPMVIVCVHGSQATSAVNGKVLLDGPDTLWATSVALGEGPGTFSWPLRG